jgi:hypothetical protein
MVARESREPPARAFHQHIHPDISQLEKQLWREHRICRVEDPRSHSALATFDFSLGSIDHSSDDEVSRYSGTLVLRINPKSSPHVGADSYECTITRKCALKLTYPTTDQSRPPWPQGAINLEDMENLAKWIESNPYSFAEIPGVEWTQVAWNMIELRCLQQLAAKLSSLVGKRQVP